MAVALHSGDIEVQEEDEDEEGDAEHDDTQVAEEDVVYGNVDAQTPTRLKHPPKKRQSVNRQFKLLGMGLGLLCVVQALLNIGLRLSLYSEWMKENDKLVKDLEQLQSRYNNVTDQKDQLQSRYDNVTAEILRIRCEPHGFILDGGVCYYISIEKKTWEESRQYCTDKQSDLIIIKSKEQEDLVERVVPRDQYVWIGLTDREEEGSFKWLDGTPLTSPTFWYRSQPDNVGGDQDCVNYYNGAVPDRGWIDWSCSGTYRWMCERVV